MCSLSTSKINNFHPTSYIARLIPNVTITGKKANKALAWIGKRISSPQNRLILGATALMSQPFIDLHNRNVDEETRKISAARTVAKIIAGTTTGFLIRYGCIKAIDYCTLLPEQITKATKNPKLRTVLTPSPEIVQYLKDLGQYKKTLGTIIALIVMTFTNFAIDAPLTRFLTNKFVDNYKIKNPTQKHNEKKEVKHE